MKQTGIFQKLICHDLCRIYGEFNQVAAYSPLCSLPASFAGRQVPGHWCLVLPAPWDGQESRKTATFLEEISQHLGIPLQNTCKVFITPSLAFCCRSRANARENVYESHCIKLNQCVLRLGTQPGWV